MEANFWIKIIAKKRYGRTQFARADAFAKKPTINEDEIALKISMTIPDEVFEEPVFEAKFVIPRAVKNVPEMLNVAKQVGDAMSKQTGFKINVSIPQEETKC